MIRVLHILGTAAPEGAATARIVRQLANGLDAARFKTEAWFLGDDGPLRGELESAGASCSVLAPLTRTNPIGILPFYIRLRRAKADIVHLHLWSDALRWVSTISGKEFLLQLHSRVVEGETAQICRRDTAGADRVIAVSRAVAASADVDHVKVIYPGLPVADSVPVKTSLVIGTASRLEAVKNLHCLIEAFAELARQFPQLTFEIAGEGSRRAELGAHVAKLGLSHRIRFLGWIPDLQPCLRRWSLLMLASRDEGFPIAALEAMAAGVPVVAPAVGGIPEMISDGVTGRLCPNGSASELATAAAEVLSSSATLASMSAASQRAVAARFSAQTMLREFDRLYSEMMQR